MTGMAAELESLGPQLLKGTRQSPGPILTVQNQLRLSEHSDPGFHETSLPVHV